MDFRDSPETAAFRSEVRDFIFNDLTDDERGAGLTFGLGDEERMERVRSVRQKLAARGWIAPAWPKEYGGMGAPVRQQAVFNEELAYHRVPGPDFIGINYVGPTLMLFGTEEQKQRFIPRILSGEESWCQGYSEPGAGSDLASLQTRAVIDGDNFVVNGQKIWTSGAHRADWIFMLVRTDPDAPKHRGISYLLVDMKTPGIEVRPLVNMAGTHEFNEVFFQDVVVPKSQLVGELNRGWYVGMSTLDFERSAIGSVASTRRDLEELTEALAASTTPVARTGRLELADRVIESNVVRMLSMRIISMQEAGLVPNHEASMNKLFTTELNQRIARTGLKLLGMGGQLRDGPLSARWVYHYLRTVANTIEGGSSEIQRNIIATRGLGLPRG
ncbi:MAG: acyl-CoA dehydrogenase family protein [Dehalococcoidia bacterium]